MSDTIEKPWGIIYMSPCLVDSMPNIVLDSRKGLMYIYGMEVVMAKTNEINGTARVTRVYSTLNGMPWETSAAEFSHRGSTYTWISDKVGSLELFEGQEVYIKAFVRGTNRLYKVTISPSQRIPHSETQCAICSRIPMQNSRYCSLHDPAPFARAVVYGAGLRDNNGRSVEEE